MLHRLLRPSALRVFFAHPLSSNPPTIPQITPLSPFFDPENPEVVLTAGSMPSLSSSRSGIDLEDHLFLLEHDLDLEVSASESLNDVQPNDLLCLRWPDICNLESISPIVQHRSEIYVSQCSIGSIRCGLSTHPDILLSDLGGLVLPVVTVLSVLSFAVLGSLSVIKLRSWNKDEYELIHEDVWRLSVREDVPFAHSPEFLTHQASAKSVMTSDNAPDFVGWDYDPDYWVSIPSSTSIEGTKTGTLIACSSNTLRFEEDLLELVKRYDVKYIFNVGSLMSASLISALPSEVIIHHADLKFYGLDIVEAKELEYCSRILSRGESVLLTCGRASTAFHRLEARMIQWHLSLSAIEMQRRHLGSPSYDMEVILRFLGRLSADTPDSLAVSYAGHAEADRIDDLLIADVFREGHTLTTYFGQFERGTYPDSLREPGHMSSLYAFRKHLITEMDFPEDYAENLSDNFWQSFDELREESVCLEDPLSSTSRGDWKGERNRTLAEIRSLRNPNRPQTRRERFQKMYPLFFRPRTILDHSDGIRRMTSASDAVTAEAWNSWLERVWVLNAELEVWLEERPELIEKIIQSPFSWKDRFDSFELGLHFFESAFFMTDFGWEIFSVLHSLPEDISLPRSSYFDSWLPMEFDELMQELAERLTDSENEKSENTEIETEEETTKNNRELN